MSDLSEADTAKTGPDAPADGAADRRVAMLRLLKGAAYAAPATLGLLHIGKAGAESWRRSPGLTPPPAEPFRRHRGSGSAPSRTRSPSSISPVPTCMC